jgi:hypothetical protein
MPLNPPRSAMIRIMRMIVPIDIEYLLQPDSGHRALPSAEKTNGNR